MIDLVNQSESAFLHKQKNSANEITQSALDTMLDRWDIDRVEISDSLEQVMRLLAEQYLKLEGRGVVGELNYLKLSWMRTGLIDKSNLYRIDCYDKRWVLSFYECSLGWTPPLIFDGLEVLRDYLLPIFQMHSSKSYEYDKHLFEAAEQLNCQFLTLLPHIISPLLCKVFENQRPNLIVYTGEFMDYSKLIYQGENASELLLAKTGYAL